ncbi:hypothetical protein sos41_26520 [Alphaproteobacteria bacterium SO-S41]|nr:hypothetical protein sos41_26520 [Alphaproteobacteria bacterium SO-S41]
MARTSLKTRTVSCTCGAVELTVTGAPTTAVVCYCDDCQAAARELEALPNAPPMLDQSGGTEFVVYRKDRVAVARGADRLKTYKFKEGSSTNRRVATCCNVPMILDFDDAKWWVDVYRARYRDDVPPLEMRFCTKFKPAGAVIPTDVMTHPGYPFRLIRKQVIARLAMMFGR